MSPMASLLELQGLIDRVNSGSVTNTDELRKLLHHPSPLVRYWHAVGSLVVAARNDKALLDEIIIAASWAAANQST